jgi:hypothetical protein
MEQRLHAHTTTSVPLIVSEMKKGDDNGRIEPQSMGEVCFMALITVKFRAYRCG